MDNSFLLVGGEKGGEMDRNETGDEDRNIAVEEGNMWTAD